ncbi:hypothetical protein AB0N16_34825 [Streptomyces sp. NPDC051105]
MGGHSAGLPEPSSTRFHGPMNAGGELTVDRIEEITTLRVPGGRLVVADP